MTDAPARVLAIMGSGETSPTMVKVHRALLASLGPPPVPAVVLDTPFGFQANAAELVERAVAYFRDSVGQDLEVASMRTAEVDDALERETMLARLRAARYVFAGPGSPSYALRQWQGSPVPAALVHKLRSGGCVTFASAAACTLGVVTVPVYEIYKVGEEPRWLPGLDLMAEAGISAAVIPHYNNAEGGTHDTRFCYLGEQRLERLERELPEGAFVLGVDEHTGLVLDLSSGTAEVVGLGVVTVRRHGRSEEIPAGAKLSIESLGTPASGERPALTDRETDVEAPTAPPAGDTASSPLLAAVAAAEAAFSAALAGRDATGAVRAMLELDDELAAWSHDTLQSDELDQGRATLRSMTVRLGHAAQGGLRDPAEVVGPFVEALLAQRAAARESKRWADADAVRHGLADLGVEVHDAPEGTTWGLRS